MAYSKALLDATKTNKYREAEKAVGKLFKQNGFEVIPAQALCNKKGQYYTAGSLKADLDNCIGNAKTIGCDDIAFIADQVMGADFFIDCGNYVVMVDVTMNLSPDNLKAKQQKLNIRLKHYITRKDISMKVFNKSTSKWVIKPVLMGIVVGFKSLESFSIDRIINTIDKIDLSKGRVLFTR